MENSDPCVFVVEDEPVAATFAVAAAREAGLAACVYESAEAMLSEVTPARRGCVVLDLGLEGMTGLQLQSALRQASVCLPVIVVSGAGDVSSAVVAMKQNAFDYFEKPVEMEKLAESIRRAVACDAKDAVERADSDLIRQRYATLSPREKQVMAAVVEGMANKQVAARLELSEKTIEVHRGNVMRKMRVDSVAALVRAALVCQGDKSSDGPGNGASGAAVI